MVRRSPHQPIFRKKTIYGAPTVGNTAATPAPEPQSIAIPTAELILSGVAPAFASPQSIDIPTATLVLSGVSPSVAGASASSIAVPTGSLVLSGQPPRIGTTLAAAILAASPLGYWKLDENSGTTATDSSGNGRNGTYSGTYTLNGWSGGDGAGYADFAAGRVSIADNNVWSADNASGITVIALIRPESAELAGTTRKMIVTKGNTNQFEWELSMSLAVAGRLRSRYYNLTGAAVIAEEYIDSALTAGTWHLVGWRSPSPTSGGRFDLYVNSASPVASSATSSAGTYANGTAAVNIGWRADSAGSQSWNGGIAHVAIFAGQLTDSQLAGIVAGAIQDGWI